MEYLEKRLTTSQFWLLGWTTWPVVAYWASCLTGVGIIFIFSLTLTVAQWYTLKQRPGNRQPALWFVLIPFYWFAATLPTLPAGVQETIGYTGAVVKFYLVQCFAELVLFFMFSSWRFGWYTCFNLLACGIWLIAFKWNEGTSHQTQMDSASWRFLLIPMVALLTNAITGYGLLKATEE